MDDPIKIRTIVTYVHESEIPLDFYPAKCRTVEEILAYEKFSIEDDPGVVIENGEMTVTVEHVPKEGDKDASH